MSEDQFHALTDVVVRFVDLAGVVVIAGGILLITLFAGSRLVADALANRRPSAGGSTDSGDGGYHTYRRRIGKAILLGLELLVAADIIRTVAVSPTLEGIAALGLLILVRTFLSFSLEVELYGRWPWQRPRAEGI